MSTWSPHASTIDLAGRQSADTDIPLNSSNRRERASNNCDALFIFETNRRPASPHLTLPMLFTHQAVATFFPARVAGGEEWMSHDLQGNRSQPKCTPKN